MIAAQRSAGWLGGCSAPWRGARGIALACRERRERRGTRGPSARLWPPRFEHVQVDSFVCDLSWSPVANAACFMNESGELGLWQLPVPPHLPPAFGDLEAAAATPVAESTPAVV